MTKAPSPTQHLTRKILIGMLLGVAFGLALRTLLFPHIGFAKSTLVTDALEIGGNLFIALMKMLVIPVVFVSVILGVTQLEEPSRLGKLGISTISFYLVTTIIAISLGLTVASLLHIGSSTHYLSPTTNATNHDIPALKTMLLNIIPVNPFKAITDGNMLQIIVFALMIGIGIVFTKEKLTVLTTLIQQVNSVLMRLISLLISLAPYGVFCLLTVLFIRQGIAVLGQLLSYFLTVTLVLLIHVLLTNSIILGLFAQLDPRPFFKKMYPAMLFAFGTASSNISIPVTLSTVKNRLGVKNTVAAFVIPLGATINMDGTAIMQGIATVFIAHVYQVPLSLTNYITIVITATLASIGTVGIPGGSGLIMLTLVLQQAGLPIEGIGLILGVDRLLEMIRTAVNITGDSAVACTVAKLNKELDINRYYTT